MKTKLSCLFLSIFLIFSGLIASSQAVGDYRTSGVAPNTWSSTVSWERFDGTTWVTPAPATPTSADGVITIRNTHTMTVNIPGGVTADQIVVEAGGTLNVNTGGTNNLTIANGAGDDLVVDGTLNVGGNQLLGLTATAVINGAMNWGAGFVVYQPITTVSSTGVVTLTGNSQKDIESNFTNNGTFNWGTGASLGGISLDNASVFTNNGTFNEQFSSNRGFIAASTGSFVNNGVFNKTTNNQLINNGVAISNTATGTMGGIGQFLLTGAFTNAGTVSPGGSPGILAASPLIVQGQTATVLIEILDLSGPGTGHDRLDLTGSTNLNGVTITVDELTLATNIPTGSMFTVMTSTGTFTGTPTVSTSNYTAAIVGGNTVVLTKIAMFPLPLVWGQFNAIARNNQVKLDWTTLEEINVSHFTVEHSVDGRTFTPIATLNAAGNTTTTTSYSFTHTAPNLQKNNIYRITETDFDNKISQSPTRLVRFKQGSVVAITATPNPMKDNLQLTIQRENLQVILSDAGGRAVRRLTLQPGTHDVNVSDLAPGFYQLNVYHQGEWLETQKLVKL